MSLFQCQECGVIENTALSHYWSRRVEASGLDMDFATSKLPDGHRIIICSECDPEINDWHGRFLREVWPLDSVEYDERGIVCPENVEPIYELTRHEVVEKKSLLSRLFGRK